MKKKRHYEFPFSSRWFPEVKTCFLDGIRLVRDFGESRDLVFSPSRSNLGLVSSRLAGFVRNREIYNLGMVSGPALLEIKRTSIHIDFSELLIKILCWVNSLQMYRVKPLTYTPMKSYFNANLLHGLNSLKTHICYSINVQFSLTSNTYVPKINKHFWMTKKKIFNYFGF